MKSMMFNILQFIVFYAFRMFMVYLLETILGIVCISGHKYFSERIPNGDRVPHPCGDGMIWGGVGHHYPGGARGTGGIRNRFGIDFKQSGLVS